MLSSQRPVPVTTVPSIGTVAPFWTLMRSPIARSSTSVSTPSLDKDAGGSIKKAFVTLKDASCDSLSTVCFFEKDYKNFPSKMTVIRVEDISKLCA